jgi:3-(3-hydroxy-phenyl)propionate hydroxylase
MPPAAMIVSGPLMSQCKTNCDVAIVGLGPIGVTLAMLLALDGHDVIGLDAAADVFDRPRAIGLDHEAMRIFQNLGVAERMAPFIETYRPSEYRAADGSILRRLLPAPEPFPLSWPSYVPIIQPELERLLRQRARDFYNLEVHLSSEVVAVSNLGGIPALDVKVAGAGPLQSLRSRYVVGCDGAGSFLRKAMSINLEDLGFNEPWLVLDILLTDGVNLPETNIQFCDPARPATFVRGPGALRRWEFMILPGESPREIATPERVWQLLRPWLRPDQGKIWRAATYRFHALVAENWRNGNGFLAGDAAHQTPPFLAQGLNQGIRDAANLAWKLSAALQGAPERLLDSYEAERRPNVREVIAITKMLGREICERDAAAAEERNRRLRADFENGNGIRVRQDLLPPLKNLLCDADRTRDTRPGEGEPFPQPWVLATGGRQRLDDVLGTGFRLILTRDFAAENQKSHARAMGVNVATIGPAPASADFALADSDDFLTNWMAKRGCKGVLVRPDHVVYSSVSTEVDLTESLFRLSEALGASLGSQ